MNKHCSIKDEMDAFFNPRGVAIIGATENPKRGGYYILRNALQGYGGKIYPVNPKYSEILGAPCYPDVDAIPEDFDLAIFFVPARFLPDTIEACARKKVRGIIIESAGFSEIGEGGIKLQQESVELARSLGIRLWGPNCMGLLDGHSRHVFSFMSQDWMSLMHPGNVSLIVQSGMLSSGFLFTMLERGGMGISKVASIGNKCDVNETELLEYLVQDEHTGVIGCYLESIIDGRRFLECARGTGKPVVVLKAGRSPQGARAAMSHTASLSGESGVYKGAFKQAGIVQVYDVHELMDFVRGFSMIKKCVPGGGTAVITFSGGAGIVTADLLSDHDLPLARLSRETLDDIKAVFPDWMEPAHPLDLWPAVEKNGIREVYSHAVEAVMKDPGVDSVIVETWISPFRAPDYLNDIAELKNKYGKPIVIWMISAGAEDLYIKYRTMAEDLGMPEFTELSRAASFIAGVKTHFRKKGSLGLLS